MPKTDTSIDPKHSKVATPPTHEVGLEIIYKELNKRSILRAPFSEEPEVFNVRICAKRLGTDNIDVSNIYEEYHPLMAVGRAVIEFRIAYPVADINFIKVHKRTIQEVK